MPIPRFQSVTGPSLIFSLLLVIFLLSPTAPLGAQVVDDSARLGECLARYRASDWRPDEAEYLVRKIAEAGHLHAAAWWQAWILKDGVSKGLEEKDLEVIRKLDPLLAKKPGRKELRKLLVQGIGHFDQFRRRKNLKEGKIAHRAVSRILEFHSDAKLERRFAELNKKFEAIDAKNARESSPGARAKIEEFRQAVDRRWLKHVDRLIEEYRNHGCRPGAALIRELIFKRQRKDGSLPIDLETRRLELDRIEFALEPKRKLELRFANGGALEIYRNGKKVPYEKKRGPFDAMSGATWTIAVLNGDRIRLEFGLATANGVMGELFVVAASAALDGESLPQKSWRQDFALVMTDRRSKTRRLGQAREITLDQVKKGADKKIYDEMVACGRALHMDFPSGRWMQIPFYEELAAAKKEMKGQKDWFWLCGFKRPFRVSLQIP